jgi:cyclohexyl-isocyanide hydratase
MTCGAFGVCRLAISNTEIGPAASSNWNSGKIRKPIMDASKNEGITPFPAPRRTWHAATVKRDVEVDMSGPLQIGLLVFPRVTQLDLTGPAQVFSSLPDVSVHLIWKRIEPIPSDSVITLTPTITFADCPQLDVVCVPGGYGTDELMLDEDVLAFLRRQEKGAKYVTSVCTGSLVLGAAGLLKGYRAATHWTATDALPFFGASVSRERVCIDRNRITGGGITAGIDFALTLVSMLRGRAAAEMIQLRMEYNPAPPFEAGSPDTAPAEIVAAMKDRVAPSQARRLEFVRKAVSQQG